MEGEDLLGHQTLCRLLLQVLEHNKLQKQAEKI